MKNLEKDELEIIKNIENDNYSSLKNTDAKEFQKQKEFFEKVASDTIRLTKSLTR